MPEKNKTEQNKDKNKILAVIGVLVVAAAILIVLSFTKSQNTTQPVDDTDVTQSPVMGAEELTSQEWTWVNTQMNDGAKTTPSTEGAFTLTFQDDGSVLATTDCNSGNGSYELGPDNSITFGPMASTMMFCEGSSETDFYGQLGEVGSYTVQDGQLWLMLKLDSGTMVFE